MSASDARPFPLKGVAYRHYFPIRKNDASLITSWTGQDSEVSKDSAVFADCTNEATEIGTSGVGYIDLTAAEMSADCVVLKVTVTNTDAVPYIVVLFPNAAILAGTVDTTAFTPTTTEFEADDITEATADHYVGRVVVFTSGALVGQATTISDYALSGGRGHFTVTALTEAPADNDTFVIY